MYRRFSKFILFKFVIILSCFSCFYFGSLFERLKTLPSNQSLAKNFNFDGFFGLENDEIFQMNFLDFSINFSFWINPPRIECENDTVLIGVVTAPKSTKQREWVRNLWLKNVLPNHLAYFFVAKSENSTINEEMKIEAEKFSDMIIVDFIDAYKNLSIKVFTMMTWKQKYCNEANYFLRTNDDTIVNFTNLQSFVINNSEHVKDLQMYGSIFKRPLPKRDIRNKWYVSVTEFPGKIYPDFCAGWSCLYTKPALNAVLNQASLTNYLWLDDVLFGGVLAQKGNVSRIHLSNLFIPNFKFKHYFNFICGSFRPINFIAVHFHELDLFLKKNIEINCGRATVK